MKNTRIHLLIGTLLISVWAMSALAAVASSQQKGESGAEKHEPRLADEGGGGRGAVGFVPRSLPVVFLENQGQWPSKYHAIARRGGMSLGLRPAGLDLKLTERVEDGSFRSLKLVLGFEGCREPVELETSKPTPGKYNFFIGSDRERWKTGVRGFEEARYRELYSGVDLRLRDGGGLIEYDFICRAGADLEQVIFSCEGVESLEIDLDGSLVLETKLGAVRQKPPISWYEDLSGEKHAVEVMFRKIGENRFGFQVTDVQDLLLIVDPGLEWSTLLGGVEGDQVTALAGSAEGVPTVIGPTNSWDFPVTAGAFDETRGPSYQPDLFVSRFTADGSALIFSTFLGGDSDETPYDIDVDDAGAAYVLGSTISPDFPITPGAFQTTQSQSGRRFVTKLSSDGSRLEYSTFYNETFLFRIRANKLGQAVLAGGSWGKSPTTPGAFDESFNGGCSTFTTADGYVGILSADGRRLDYGTYIGGSSCDGFYAISLGPGSSIVLGGVTISVDFPTTAGAFDRSLNDNSQFQGDGVVLLFDPQSAQPVRLSTLAGGTHEDVIRAVEVDGLGRVYAAGYTVSSNFPVTPTAYDTTFDGSSNLLIRDAFVLCLSADGQRLEYSTFLGGAGTEFAYGLEVDSANCVTVCGTTSSLDFPTTKEAVQPVFNGGGGVGGGDAFITRLNASGTGLLYSTFLGGSGGFFYGELALGLSLDRDGHVIVGGLTESADFPTTPGAFDQVFWRGEGFLSKLDPGPFLSFTGTATPGALFRFNLTAASVPPNGASAQVVLSCSGTAGVSLPGGLTLPLTPDACTQLSLKLGGVLRCSIDGVSGTGSTSAFVFPQVPAGRKIFAAAMVWDGATGAVFNTTDAIEMLVR